MVDIVQLASSVKKYTTIGIFQRYEYECLHELEEALYQRVKSTKYYMVDIVQLASSVKKYTTIGIFQRYEYECLHELEEALYQRVE